MKTLSKIILFTVGCAVVVPLYAGSDDSNEAAIKARRALMTLHGWYAGPLFRMAKGAMWPVGSDNEAYEGQTRARIEGWSEYDPQYNEALVKASHDMAEAAGSGLDALRVNIKALGESCGGCHDAYRADDF